jgi:hypothetical protein
MRCPICNKDRHWNYEQMRNHHLAIHGREPPFPDMLPGNVDVFIFQDVRSYFEGLEWYYTEWDGVPGHQITDGRNTLSYVPYRHYCWLERGQVPMHIFPEGSEAYLHRKLVWTKGESRNPQPGVCPKPKI